MANCSGGEENEIHACVKALLDSLALALVQAFSIARLQPSIVASAPLTVGMEGLQQLDS